ncbi:unnamed protein product [Choristocarpus tenellus]
MDKGLAIAFGLLGVGLVLVGYECYLIVRSQQQTITAVREACRQRQSWQSGGQRRGLSPTISKKFSRLKLKADENEGGPTPDKKNRWFSRLLGRDRGQKAESLRTSEISSESLSSEPCLVCLESMGTGLLEAQSISLLRLPCGHIFHETCIDIWMRDSVVCPTCKRRLDRDLSIEEPLNRLTFV